MKAVIKTQLDIPADAVWHLLRQHDTFLYITRGFLGFTGAKWAAKQKIPKRELANALAELVAGNIFSCVLWFLVL